MKLVVLIPALNEAQSISKVVKNIPRAITGVKSVTVVVVDDGSTDNTAQLAATAGAIVVSHDYNRGVGAAFQSGLRKALDLDADICVNIDADGQFSPLDIPKMVQPILSGEADFATADRFHDDEGNTFMPEHMPRVKYWGNRQVSRLISFIAGRRFSDVSCGFRAYSKTAMLHLNLVGRFTYTQESFLDLATKELRIVSVPVVVQYFPGRTSRVAGSIPKYAMRISGIIFRTFRDHQPIRFFGLFGLGFFLAGGACVTFALWHFAAVGSFSPYKSVALIGAYLWSLAFLIWVVGIMADMLDRVRINQEKMLFMLKRMNYEVSELNAPPEHRRIRKS